MSFYLNKAMHGLTVFWIISALWFASSNAAKYSGRFDTLDIDEILRSDRLLKNYFECLMHRGPCSPEGSELRRTIPDALKTECEKCTESQRTKAGKAIEFLIKNKPEMYKELEQKYDPDGSYRMRIREKYHFEESS